MTSPPEKQLQIITSPDDKVQVINYRASRDGFAGFLVEGTIKNISTSELSAKLIIDYYDENNIKIDSETDILTALKPGATRGFYIIYPGPKRSLIRHYKINISPLREDA